MLVDWCQTNSILIHYIQPGKPNQNAYIERFNRTYRNEVLNLYLFRRLDDVREITSRWLVEYNEQRPHDALGELPPRDYAHRMPESLLLNCLLDGEAYGYGSQAERMINSLLSELR